MIEIIVLKKSWLLMVCISVVFVSLVAVLFSQYGFDNSPAYVVVNRWYDNDEKRINLNDYIIDDDITLHTTITASQFINPKLVIKAKNADIMARTDGRIILDTKNNNADKYGFHYYIVDAGDLDGGVVYLHLSPKKFHKGKIMGTVYLTTQNDFLYNRKAKTMPYKILAVAILHIILYILLIKLKFIFRKY